MAEQPGTAGCTSGHGKPSTVLFDTQAPDVFMQKRPTLQEILPKSGLIVSEKGGLTELLCKPKIMPLKSITLQKLEEMEAQVAALGQQQQAATRPQTGLARFS